MSFFGLNNKVDSTRTPLLKNFDCSSCKLDKGCLTPMMDGYGSINADIMFVGEAPGGTEDKDGRPFVGSAGELLRETTKELNININNCFITNTVRCRPFKNQTPTTKQIKCCYKYLEQEIKKINPKIIVLLGKAACEAIIGKGGIGKYRGYHIPFKKYNCILVPVLHPSGILRDNKLNIGVFKKDLAGICDALNKWNDYFSREPVLQITNYAESNLVVEDFDELIGLLYDVRISESKFAIDWEAIGLKPFNNNSLLLYGGIALSGKESFTFQVENYWNNRQLKQLKEELGKLLSSDCIKIFWNYKMEQKWAMKRLGIKIKNNIRDGMLLSYVLNEVRGTHSLDFQAFVNFGVTKVKGVDKYKKDMSKCPPLLAHKYCSTDAKLTYRLGNIFYPKVEKDKELFWVYNELLLKGTDTTLKSEIEGTIVDIDRINKLIIEFNKEKKLHERKIFALPEVKNFIKKNDGFNLGSPKDVKNFMYNYLKLNPFKFTDKGNKSVDAEVLEHYRNYGVEFCDNLLTVRTMSTLTSTHLEGMKNSIYDDGLLHTDYNLHLTETGRLSSSDPNLQNVPVREYGEIRSAFIPLKNHIMMAFDYSGIEVRVTAMFSKDKNLVDGISNKYDMHGEWGYRIYNKRDEETRFKGKNSFVFPKIYGSSYKNIAKNLNISESKSKQFCYEFEKEYPDIKNWQEELIEGFKRDLYVKTLFGRKRRAPLEYTQLINSPVQGTATDFCLLSMIKADDYRIPLIVHDELVLYVPDTIKDIKDTYEEMVNIMTTWNEFDFVNVPLEVECKIGTDWHNMINIEEIL